MHNLITVRSNASVAGTAAYSHATFSLDNKYPRFTSWMCDMLTTYLRKEHVAWLQCNLLFSAVLPVMHINDSIENSKYFLTVIHVPFVWLVCPMHACGDAVHIGEQGSLRTQAK